MTLVRRIRALLIRTRNLFTRSAAEREFEEELRSNLQLHIDANLEAGMGPDESRRSALAKLGGLDATREAWRDQKRITSLCLQRRELPVHPPQTVGEVNQHHGISLNLSWKG